MEETRRREPRPEPWPGARPSTRARGRMSAAKLTAVETLGPRYGLDLDPATPLADRLAAAFGRRAPRLLDVGVGTAEATVAWALAHPEGDVVVAELHRPSVAQCLAAVDAAGCTNVRVAEVDARVLLAEAARGDLHDVRLLFPDPWPKRRHHDRRLVDATFVAVVADVLPVGGTLQVATDWPDYADQVAAVTAADGRFAVDPAAARPDRPVTTYEAMGVAAGRPVADLVATRLPL